MNKETPAEESPIEYPCVFNVKVMGIAGDELRAVVNDIASRNDSHFNEAKTAEKYSSSKKYLSMSIAIYALNRDQLDALYTELTAHELVKWVI